MSKKKKTTKTLVEKILDQAKIAYESFEFPTEQEGDVRQIKLDEAHINDHLIYKTLALTGQKTGPVIGVVPLDERINYKKLAKVSGNRKVGMVPLKELIATTGYEHGANSPVAIHQTHGYPIYFATEAQNEPTILVSAGKLGRSVKVDPRELVQFLGATFADIAEPDTD